MSCKEELDLDSKENNKILIKKIINDYFCKTDNLDQKSIIC
jgi:hypothetical protein